MSNISGQLIKDSYNYVLQSDLTTGIVYRIGGAVPVNPIFSSGLTILSSFKYQDGSEINGYVLTSDSSGNATWKPVSGGTGGTTVTGGTFDYSAKTLTLYNSDGNDVTITGLTDTFITAFTYNNNTFTIRDNSGQTLSATINSLTGITINGDLNVDYIDFNLTANPAHQEGRIHWNDDTKTLEVDTENNQVHIEVGHENLVRVVNNTGSPLLKGTLVYINGAQGGRPTITKASYEGDNTSARTLGFVAANINNNNNGYVITYGILRDVNTLAYSAGTPIFLFTGGTYTNIRPIAPLHEVRLGYILSQNATTGSIFVNVMNGYELTELHDVSATTVNNLDVLQWNSSQSVWQPTSNPRFNSISATTYYGLPLDINVTSGTYNNSTGIATFTNNTGGTFDVSGFFKISDVTYVTGGTYTNGNIIFRNNQGGSFGITSLPIGGAGGQVYYLNLSQNENGYQEFSPIATTQPEQTTGVTINALSTETIASFLTPTGYPNTNLIPSGVWSFYLHSYKDSSLAEIDIFCEIYLRDTGGTETFLLSTDSTPITSNSPTPTMEITDGYYSGRTISVDDRILVKVRATNNKNTNHTVTFLTEGNTHYSYGVTPFSDNTQFTCDDITGCTVINDILVSLDDKIQYYYQNTAPTGTIVVGSIWQHSETGVEYTYNYDGNSYQWVQQTLPVGPQGPQGANGTNNIDSGTTTTFNGILVGDGVTVSSSTITTLIGYTPENVANKETSALDNSNTKYPTNNVVNTALQSFSDDVDYATMINQRILFNY